MKQITLLLLLTLLCACIGTKPIYGSIKNSRLNGSWSPIRQEIGGSPLPDAVFQEQVLTIRDSSYTLKAESIDEGFIVYTGTDKMDIYGKVGPNAGRHYSAIYKLENEQLIVCYDLSGLTYPPTFSTAGKATYFMSVYKKIPTP